MWEPLPEGRLSIVFPTRPVLLLRCVHSLLRCLHAGVDKMAALNEFSSVQSANGGYPCRVQVDVLGRWEPWAQNEGSNETAPTVARNWPEVRISH